MKDGGPAFPTTDYEGTPDGRIAVNYWGMSLRDWFAGTADISKVEFPSADEMAQFVGSDAMPDSFIAQLGVGSRVVAKLRYMMADAMLAEREKA